MTTDTFCYGGEMGAAAASGRFEPHAARALFLAPPAILRGPRPRSNERRQTDAGAYALLLVAVLILAAATFAALKLPVEPSSFDFLGP